MTRHAALAVIAVTALTGSLAFSAAAFGQENSDYEARLQAGREAAYRQYHYLLRPSAKDNEPTPTADAGSAGGSTSTGSTGATFRAAGVIATPSMTISAGDRYFSQRQASAAPITTLTRYGYEYNQRYRPSEPSEAALIFHPNYDPRHRRSWPRPVQTRTYVPSHWTWDGSRYRYVASQVVYQTQWVTVSRERWNYNGSHYSVEKWYGW